MSEEIKQPEIFSKWFTARLQEKGMSAGEFAQAARISRAASYFYVSGARVPNAQALDKIAAFLGVDRASLPTFVPRRSE